MYLGLTLRRDSCFRVSRTRVTAMINQNFRPAGAAHCPSSVACYRHCRRGDRLNPFNDDARENRREEEGRDIIGRDGPCEGTPFLGPARERGDPCSDKACPVFPSLLLISFRLSFFYFPFFTFLRRDRWPRRPFRKFVSRWCNGHNAPKGRPMCVDRRTVRSKPGNPTKMRPTKERRKCFNSCVEIKVSVYKRD